MTRGRKRAFLIVVVVSFIAGWTVADRQYRRSCERAGGVVVQVRGVKHRACVHERVARMALNFKPEGWQK